MIPFIHTRWGDISTYTLCVVVGILAMLGILHLSLKKTQDRYSEEVFIIPKMVVCGLSAFVFATLLDTLFKFLKYGTFVIGGITFYGGLIGALLALYIQLKIAKRKNTTRYSIAEWFDLLTPPLILFHFFGRIGCFLAGCCYGKPTSSVVGMVFPDNPQYEIIHNGMSLHPTQLYEAILLLVIFIVVLFTKHKFQVYLLYYAVGRYFIEYLRGDDRGFVCQYMSPAQAISLCIILVLLICRITYMYKKANK